MTITPTRPGAVATGLAAILGFIRAVAGDLPDPVSVTVHNFSTDVNLMFGSLDDLRNWAAYSFVDVETHHSETTGRVHHRAETTWGPVDGKMVTFRMTFLEDALAELPRDCDAAELS